MRYKNHILESFQKFDKGDPKALFNQLSEDIEWIINKETVIRGKDNVKKQIEHLITGIKTVSHEFLNIWEVDDTYIITADVTFQSVYRGREELSCTAIVDIKNGTMAKIEVFTQ